ncbi:hypothetical protein PR202_gb27641 [Eleusine coracana subsp. coracana]|uniref:Uncharacterized protein n=1 Tax=Eleusine coracana subsp. coracana TaxID=191504 RepID=A0AAV5FUU5_ELECO|nr:hypothetical protein PR202_gb27641 [Eleusine coracana subsp. coracana]
MRRGTSSPSEAAPASSSPAHSATEEPLLPHFDPTKTPQASRRRRRRPPQLLLHAMAHLRLLLSHTRRHPQPHRLLPLFHFSSDAKSSSAPPPPIKPVSYAPKPKPPPDESVASPAPGAPVAGPGSQSPLPRRPQQQQQPPQRQWTREEMRFVKDAAPGISPVSYPSRVAPLPEDQPAVEDDAGAEDALCGEGQRIQLDAARARSIFGMQVEEEQLPYPTLIPVEKRPQKVSIDLVDAIRLVKTSANEKKRNFVETVEAHVMLGVDPRRGDQVPCAFNNKIA